MQVKTRTGITLHSLHVFGSPRLSLPAGRNKKSLSNNFFKETAMQRIGVAPRHILTFDLEEHFQATRFDSPMRRRLWSSFQSRVQSNVERILELLAHHSTRATFFALGWVAEQHPSVIRAVATAGRLHQLCRDFRFGPVGEVILPIRDQARSTPALAVPDSTMGDHQYEPPQLTTV